jgi:predicted membrane-bound spermidine synthase
VEGLIPNSFFRAFTLVGFVGSLVLIYSFKAAGIMFTIGWVWGAWVLKDLLGTFDFFVYFIAPIAALVIRAAVAIKQAVD